MIFEKNLLEVLELLEKTTGTLDKISILKKYKEVDNFKKYLSLAMDDRITFGIAKVPEYKRKDGDCPFELFDALCEQLVTRSSKGNAARDLISTLLSYSTELQEKWWKKCIEKDLSSIGIGASLVNKAFGELFILDFRCSGASDPKKIDKMIYDANSEMKKNGIRSLVFTDENGLVDIPPFNTEINVIGRSGLPIPEFNFIISEINKLKLANRVFDGEISVEDNLWETQTLSSFKFRDKSEFIGAKGKLKEKAWKDYQIEETEVLELQSRAKYTLFEVLDRNEFMAKDIKEVYIKRRETLEILGKTIDAITDKIEIVEAVTVHSKIEAIAQANKWIEEGLEGAVIKTHNGKYGFTKDNSAIKIKRLTPDIDAKITRIDNSKQSYTTTGKLDKAMAGRIYIEYINPVTGILIESGVGTGIVLTRKVKQDMVENPDKYIGTIVECTGTELSEDGILICPRINRIREKFDKLKLD